MDVEKFKKSFNSKKYAFNFVFDLIDTLNGDVKRVEYVGSTDCSVNMLLESLLNDAHCQCEHINVEFVSFNFTLTNNFKNGTKEK